MMKFWAGVVSTLVVLGIFFAVFPYTGVFDVAASHPHSSFVRRYLSTTMWISVKHGARSVALPSYSLKDPKLMAMGLDHFNEMCVSCHGAPGLKRSEAGQGLYPKGPGLSHAYKYWTPQQLFWIVKNGVKMTGMPEFGSTHSDHMIWGIVAFLENELPTQTPADYKTAVSQLKKDSD